MAQLTPRQQDVVEALAEGLSNQEIAQRLSVQPVTVKKHLSNVYSKLQVSGRTELVALLFSPPPERDRAQER